MDRRFALSACWAAGLTCALLSLGCPPVGRPLPGVAPQISNLQITGDLTEGQPGTLTVSATVTDADSAVESVVVDLRPFAGEADTALTEGANNVWTWTGQITSPTSGTKVVRVTATDDTGVSSSVVGTVDVKSPTGEQAPEITTLTVSGSLVEGQAVDVTITATVTDADDAVQSVVADLREIGGPSAVPLLKGAGNTWTATVNVTPDELGQRTITVVATDESGNTGVRMANVTVSDTAGNQVPQLSTPNVIGTLTVNQAGTVNLSVTATDADGTIDAVTANLSAIGGPASVALTAAGGDVFEAKNVAVTPTVAGTRTIVFTARDDAGAEVTTTTTINVANPGPAGDAPEITNAKLTGVLNEAEEVEVTVEATVTDPDSAIQEVVADVSAIGGPAAAVLIRQGGSDVWKWTGTLTPPTRGAQQIVVKARDVDALETTQSINVNVTPPLGSELWSLNLDAPIHASPAQSLSRVIFIATADGTLKALNLNATERWLYQAPPAVLSTPTVASDGTVYLGSEDFSLHSISPNGIQNWTFGTGYYVDSSPAIGVDGTVYVGSTDGNVYAIDPVTGLRDWAFATGAPVLGNPAIAADGTIYAGAFGNSLFAIQPDGKQKWAASVGPFRSSPAIGADGTVYIGSGDGHLYALNPANGQIVWDFATGGIVDSSPAIGPDDVIYVGSNDGHLYAINPNGTQKWAFDAGADVMSSPTIGSDGTVYFGTDAGTVYALRTADGSVRWSATTGDAVTGSPLLDSSGVLIIGSYDGFLYGLQASGRLADAPWPTFAQDSQRQGR